MYLRTSSTSTGQFWRAFQETNIVSRSRNSSQISYAGNKLRVKSMSHAGNRSIAMFGDKRMKVQKSIWRPVYARSHSSEGKKNEDTDAHIKITHREYSSAANAKHWIVVDAALLRFVKGKGGKVQQKIEETTGVKISFKSTEDENAVVLDGPSIESVNTAATIIQNVLDEAVKGPNLQYSHFISLPLAVHPVLVEKLTTFQNSILALSSCVDKEVVDSESSSTAQSSEDDCEEVCKVETTANPADEISDVKEVVAVKFNVEDGNAHVGSGLQGVSSGDAQAKTQTFFSQAKKNLGIDKSIFIKPATFHLTVLMLKLWNKERVASAAEVLQKVSPQVKKALEDRPVAVSLKGLEIMRGKPAKAHVLYAPVEEVGGGGFLQRACRVIIDGFVEAGLVMQKDATSALKLHATLMNTSHRKMKKLRRYSRNFPFDARPVMELYGSENWGQYVIHEAHLSQRFKFDDNGYYHCCSSIFFPKVNTSDDDTAETTKEIAVTTAQEMAEEYAKENDADSKEEINPESAGATAKENAKETDMRAI